ncbi:hypothetical protein [Brevibacterium spongiae]|uniref:Uncharacterized protein n=1 Tax=Brevibacterium spongiae TaxID=2909672 RepID=A0ABY5SNF1_9MICO|nr:hypothetical protein [Brevibacterium spongiae]UVI34599.1 hypothetical protein L1F31_10670 [Brevibacterium spongiae]
MAKKIRDLDYVLAGRLAEMIGTAGDVEVRGSEMTFPMRDSEGSILNYSFDVRGLADQVEENISQAVVANGNSRGAQRAALEVIASNILKDNNDLWDIPEPDKGDVVYHVDNYEPIVIDMKDFPPRRRK